MTNNQTSSTPKQSTSQLRLVKLFLRTMEPLTPAFWGLLAVLVFVNGCGSNNQRLTQLQNENDRLLSEYRAQRDQLTLLNEKLAVAQNRLAESEKLLARQTTMPSTRLSRLNDPASMPSAGPAFGSQSKGSSSAPSGSVGNSAAGPSGKPTSASSANGDPSSASELYWRPMRRESR